MRLKALQKPLPDEALKIVSVAQKDDTVANEDDRLLIISLCPKRNATHHTTPLHSTHDYA